MNSGSFHLTLPDYSLTMQVTKAITNRPVFLFLVALIALSGCSKDKADTGNDSIPGNLPAPGFYNLAVESDKACYRPGEEVNFSLTGPISLPARVRYKNLNTLVEDIELNGTAWKWKTPDTDFKGYLAEVYGMDNNKEVIYAAIAIDVSSDWTKFPRYGFLSNYYIADDQNIHQVIADLNRYHINGLQFYDWHNKHHKPLPLSGGVPESTWKDIGNRSVYLNTVKRYIQEAHGRNMKAMFYNLLYGAWDDARADGVEPEWYIFTDNTRTNLDFLALSNPFLSNLYLLDPSNPGWQHYLAAQHEIVYNNLDFDGYHIDQLGDRGSRYTYNGHFLNLAQSFGSFLEANNTAFPGKYAVMNAVNQYGQQTIAQSPVNFLYTEVWQPFDTYKDLASIIKQNNMMAGGTKNQVLAAYVNYELSDTREFFNDASVLFADAVIFAFGGAHLELGEHMLSREYFPYNKLRVSESLRTALVAYYDFMVAYQNLLRDGGSFNTITLHPVDDKVKFAAWPETSGCVSVACKQVGERQVIHLINFTASTTTSWRDNPGIQALPPTISGAKISFTCQGQINDIWMASPDIAGGSPRNLEFLKQGDKISIEIPSLKYWNMIVVE